MEFTVNEVVVGREIQSIILLLSFRKIFAVFILIYGYAIRIITDFYSNGKALGNGMIWYGINF